MNEYFFLTEKIKPNTAFAYTENETLLSHELIPNVISKPELPFILTLKEVVIVRSGLQTSNNLSKIQHLWLDYQPNNLSWPLMSEKMKNVVIANLTGLENIIWIKAKIKSNDEYREYFIPCFQQKLDVIDEQKTIYVLGTSQIIKPIFSLEKVKKYTLFHKPQEYFWEITSSLYTNNILKKAMQKEKLTGLHFEKISVI